MTTAPAIPSTASDITTGWMNQVLAQHHSAPEVSAVDVAPIGTGQMATSLRVRLQYTAASVDFDDSVVVKISSDDPNSREAGARGAYLREVRYYELLDDGLSVATPRHIWSAIDTESHGFALVLQDMHPAEQGDQIQGCTVDEALAASLNIAGLHAPRWRDESLYELEWLTAPRDQLDASYAEAKAIVALCTPGFIDRYQGRLSTRHIEVLQWFAEHIDEWLQLGDGAFGLTHADHRLDNLLFKPNDTSQPVTVVDWQTIGVRNPVTDVSYLLGTGLEPEVRRSVEHDIVSSYHKRLVALGVRGYSAAQCFDDYRAQTPHALLLTVLGSMLTGQTDRGDDMFMAMLHRSVQQMFDLDVR